MSTRSSQAGFAPDTLVLNPPSGKKIPHSDIRDELRCYGVTPSGDYTKNLVQLRNVLGYEKDSTIVPRFPGHV